MKLFKKSNQKVFRSVFSMALACGPAAASSVLGQTNSAPAATNVTTLNTVTVEGQLNEARSSILTSVGASTYTINSEAIQNEAQGDNATFNQVLLRVPGVAEDNFSQLHARGEHANLQYRINDVLLPEGITGFGQELDPRFVHSMQFITGSLPAEYGFRTAGIIDIQTSSGAFTNGGTAEVFGGSYDTVRPSFEYGGSQGKWSYFVDGSYTHDGIGIENPEPTSTPVHDYTDQYRSFMYMSYVMDPTSRLVVMGSLSYSDFEIPINTTLPQTLQPNGSPWVGPTTAAYPDTALNDNQNEQNYYGVVAYQKSSGDLNYQLSAYGRDSGAHYVPGDVPAAQDYNYGIATDENRILAGGGAQLDASYALGDKHTLRGGLQYLHESVTADTTTYVFETNGVGNEVAPETFVQDNHPSAEFGGAYLQDEWKIVPRLTLNAGVRFDVYSSTLDDENQCSPRANLVYKPWDTTTLHVGYSRYFTPPPLEAVPVGAVAQFNGTSGAQAVTSGSPVRAERANYYDAGISQQIVPGLTVGADGYYKTAVDQLDDGYFGQSLIISSFNYTEGRVRGLEFTANYDHGGFSSYANFAYSVAQGRGAASAQFLWPDAAVENYVNNHWISLDHDQRLTGSFGVAYTWKESGRWSTRVFADDLYGSGLRTDGDLFNATDHVPNGASVGQYYSLNFGVEETLRLTKNQMLKARLDIVNITDNSYPLRNGAGVGVNAASYGERRGFFGSLSYVF